MKKVLEADLRTILRDERKFPFGTVSFCEFAIGGDPGLPDCWIAGNRCWIPCELKRGDSVEKNLRPTQRRWHRSSIELGIRTFGMALSLKDEAVTVFELKIAAGGLFEVQLGKIQSNLIELRHFIVLINM